MYVEGWPIGTIHYAELPAHVQADMAPYIDDISGERLVSEDLPLHQTATEGPYIQFGGYKIRVTIEQLSSSTFLVHLA